MGAAERIEWSGEYPALLWSLHPCESSDEPIEPANDNARRLTMVERRNAPQSEESFPHARAGVLCDNEYRSVEACTPSTRQGEAQLAQAHRAEQAGGWGLPNYAPCEEEHEAYSAPSGGRDAENLEVSYYYDSASTLPSGVAPSGWTGSVGGSFTLGRAIAVLDRGSASFTSFDGRGRSVRSRTRICKPSQYSGGAPIHQALAERYAPRVYERNVSFDAADREVAASTGLKELSTSTGNASLNNFLSPSGESEVTTAYSARGAVKSSGSSYGSLVSDIVRTADNLVTSITYGDAAETKTAYLYDERRRISSVQTYRGPPASGYWTLNDNSTSSEPTQQMVLQDEDFLYDVVGNPVEIRDWRDAIDWPAGAKPVTKKIEYDDLYRATRIRYDYSTGDDVWKSPFEADLDSESSADEGPRRAQPSPHVSFERRILEQKFEYDWAGNNEKTSDDASGFYDRSLGTITNDSSNEKPYQLRSASLSGARGGQLEARYDAAGHMTRMALQRSGPCLGGASTDCNQQFVYDWDEVGRLARARRWDGNTDSVDTFAPTSAGTPAADLRHVYDASDQRVIKEAVDEEDEHSYTLYVFSSLELRRAQYGTSFADSGNPGDADYEVNHWTVTPYLMANGVRLARLVYHGEDVVPEDGVASGGMPGDVNASTSQLHVFFELGDHLGSTSVVLDKATGELVERATFQGYGGAESDYRPGRWANFREDYRFTGKEEDVEVGLQYFGFRYLNPLLGRWISPDPLEVHTPGGSGELNVYSYVSGAVLKNVDPLGLCDGNQSCEAIQSNSDGSTGNSDGSVDNSSNVVTIPEVTIVGQLDAQDSDPSPGAEGASGVDDGRTGGSGESTECVGIACRALAATAEAIGSLAKSATPLAPTGDSPCRTASDCQQRSEQADAGLVAGPAAAGAAKFLRSASASRAAGRVAGAEVGADAVKIAEKSGQTARGALITEGKLGYLLGKASGRAHNLERAAQNARQLGRVGVHDTPAGRGLLQAHLEQVAADPSNIARTFSNEYGNFVVKESLFTGPGGTLKFESTWQVVEGGGMRLSTAIPFGG